MPMNERKFIDVDGISTCYYEQGEGPILVLFHGGNFGSNDAADCALDWALNFDELSEKYHVFAIDKIGQGYTANPKNDGDYTMDHTAAVFLIRRDGTLQGTISHQDNRHTAIEKLRLLISS